MSLGEAVALRTLKVTKQRFSKIEIGVRLGMMFNYSDERGGGVRREPGTPSPDGESASRSPGVELAQGSFFARLRWAVQARLVGAHLRNENWSGATGLASSLLRFTTSALSGDAERVAATYLLLGKGLLGVADDASAVRCFREAQMRRSHDNRYFSRTEVGSYLALALWRSGARQEARDVAGEHLHLLRGKGPLSRPQGRDLVRTLEVLKEAALARGAAEEGRAAAHEAHLVAQRAGRSSMQVASALALFDVSLFSAAPSQEPEKILAQLSRDFRIARPSAILLRRAALDAFSHTDPDFTDFRRELDRALSDGSPLHEVHGSVCTWMRAALHRECGELAYNFGAALIAALKADARRDSPPTGSKSSAFLDVAEAAGSLHEELDVVRLFELLSLTVAAAGQAQDVLCERKILRYVLDREDLTAMLPRSVRLQTAIALADAERRGNRPQEGSSICARLRREQLDLTPEESAAVLAAECRCTLDAMQKKRTEELSAELLRLVSSQGINVSLTVKDQLTQVRFYLALQYGDMEEAGEILQGEIHPSASIEGRLKRSLAGVFSLVTAYHMPSTVTLPLPEHEFILEYLRGPFTIPGVAAITDAALETGRSAAALGLLKKAMFLSPLLENSPHILFRVGASALAEHKRTQDKGLLRECDLALDRALGRLEELKLNRTEIFRDTLQLRAEVLELLAKRDQARALREEAMSLSQVIEE